MRKTIVPLTLINLNDDGFHLLVEIVVYGETHFAVLDTGASRTVFDTSFTDKYANKTLEDHDFPVDDNFATTLFSTSNTVMAIFPEIRLGRLRISEYSAVALDLTSVNEAYSQLGHPTIAGIIGGDILHLHQAVINYKNLKMTLTL